MTYREMLERDHPECVGAKFVGGCAYCPGLYYEGGPSCDEWDNDKCYKCWNTTPDTAQEAPRTAENTIRVMLDPGGYMPIRAHDLDVGYDLFSPAEVYLFPRQNNGTGGSVEIDTGVHIQLPRNIRGKVASKSGLMFNNDIITDGTVDPGYTGPIKVKLFNLGNSVFHIMPGQKIAQLILEQVITPDFEQVDSLEATDRGNGGFGSTGAF